MALEQFFFDNPVPCWVYQEKTHRFLTVNQSTVREYGYSEEEFLTRLIIDDMLPEEDRELLRDYVQQYKDLTRSGIWRHRRKDGKIFYVRIYSYQTKLNGQQCRYVMAVNVDEEVRLQRVLRARFILPRSPGISRICRER